MEYYKKLALIMAKDRKIKYAVIYCVVVKDYIVIPYVKDMRTEFIAEP